MQMNLVTKQVKRLTADGITGILPELKMLADTAEIIESRFKNDIYSSDASGPRLFELYKEAEKRVYKKNLSFRLKTNDKHLNRIMRQIERAIIKEWGCPEYVMNYFRFNKLKLTKAIEYRSLLQDYLLEIFRNEIFFIKAIETAAKLGHEVDFSKANDLQKLMEGTKKSINTQMKIDYAMEHPAELDLDYEHYVMYLEQLYEGINEEVSNEGLTNEEYFEILGQYYKEINRCVKEKSKIENLCFYLLYQPLSNDNKDDDTSQITDTMEDISGFYEKQYSPFRNKLLNLSTTNLGKLIRFYCRVYNNIHRKELENQREEKKRILAAFRYKRKQGISAKDKRDFIQSYKTDGLNQEQVANIIECNIRTVKRYWN